MRTCRSIVWLALILLVSNASAQVMETIQTGHTCSFFGEDIPESVVAFSSDSEAENAIKRILDASGLVQNFQIRAAGVPNAAAVIYGDKRFILYNQHFMRDTRRLTSSDWAAISIMAHEVGHHLNGHTLDNLGSRPSIELEADYYSGFILQRLGATMEEARLAMQTLGSAEGSETHPARHNRLAAIDNGWIRACQSNPGCNDEVAGSRGGITPGPETVSRMPAPTPQPRSSDAANSCQWAFDGECDEPNICAAGTDTADCSGPGASRAGPNSCQWAFDGECDEPDLCPVGTDTADCQTGNVSTAGPNSCQWAFDGECDEPNLCPRGTDTADCQAGNASTAGPDSCRWAFDGECDEPGLCPRGTDTADCRGGNTTVSGPNSCQWAFDGECDEPDVCARGTDTADCQVGTRLAGQTGSKISGFSSGRAMQDCGCWGSNPMPTAPEPRCQSGHVQLAACDGQCAGGGSPYGFVCQ